MKTFLTTVAAAALISTAATAQDGPLRILALDDLTGMYSGKGGPNSVRSIQLAVDDFGGEALGQPIKVLSADHQDKPVVGSALAQRFIDEQGVTMMALGGSSAVGLAAQVRAGEAGVISISSGGYAPNFSGDQCTPYSIHWAPTTREVTRGVAGAVVEQGGDSWYLLTADYVFGHALAADATAAVEAAGGSVVGQAVHPLNTNDMASALLSAQGSGAKVFGLANAGTDLEATIKQAAQMGLSGDLAAMLVLDNNVQALGLEAAQGIRATTSFYWDHNDASRAYGTRLMEMNGGQVSTMGHAGAYASTLHYLQAVESAGTTDPDAVIAAMKANPITSGIFENATPRTEMLNPLADPDALARVNPARRVPTLILDDGTILTEAMLIARYAVTVSPEHSHLRADDPQQLSITGLGFGVIEAAVYIMTGRKITSDDLAITEFDSHPVAKRRRRAMAEGLTQLAQRADDLSPERLGLAELIVADAIQYIDFRFPRAEWRPAIPRLDDWLRDAMAHPSVRDTVPS